MEIEINEIDGGCTLRIFPKKTFRKSIRKKEEKTIEKLFNVLHRGDKIVFKEWLGKDYIMRLRLNREKNQ